MTINGYEDDDGEDCGHDHVYGTMQLNPESLFVESDQKAISNLTQAVTLMSSGLQSFMAYMVSPPESQEEADEMFNVIEAAAECCRVANNLVAPVMVYLELAGALPKPMKPDDPYLNFHLSD